MKILLLEVYRYRRLSLNPKMEKISFKPNKKLILILGDNGAGKSSFLDLLCPRIIPTKDFRTGGYCRLTFELDDVKYKLTTEDNKYSFIRFDGDDEENLNPVGGLRQQEALLSNLLNIDVSIQSLLTGATQFTKLGVAARRDIMEKLSGSDYTYISHVYKQSQARMKDAKAVIDYAQQQLVTHQSELIIIDKDSEDVEDKLTKLDGEIKTLLGMCNNNHTDIDKLTVMDATSKVEERDLTLRRMHKKLMATLTENITLGNYHNLDFIYTTLNDKLAQLGGRRDALMAQHYELDQELNTVDGTVPIEEIKGTLKRVEKKLDLSIVNSFSKDEFGYDNPSVAVATINSVRGVLDALECVDDVDYNLYLSGYVTEDKLDDMSKQVAELHNQLVSENELLEHYAHMKKDKVTCPKCKHMWTEGYDEDKHKKLLNTNSDTKSSYRSLKVQLDGMQDTWGRLLPFIDAKHHYDMLAPETKSILKPVLDPVNKTLKKTTKGITNITTRHLSALEYLKDKVNMEAEQEYLRKQINAYDGIANELLTRKQHKFDSITDDINLCNKAIRSVRKRLVTINNIIILRNKIKDMLSDNTVVNEWNDAVSGFIDTMKDTAMRRAIDIKVKEINKLRLVYSNRVRHQQKVAELKATIGTKEVELNTSKRLMTVTNPKGKLVAQSMLTFLNAFIEEMNVILDKVWNYPLEIQPFKGDLESLTYRFKFKAGSDTRDDLSQASNATSDIIDIAFKMVAMNALGLKDFPLYLDELGEGYDDTHKINLCNVVDNYLMKKNYSNIFVVAQVKEIYEYFSSLTSDRVVLSGNNMSMATDESNSLCVL